MKIQDFQDNVTCGGFDNIFANIYKPQDIESQKSRYISAVEKFTALYPNRNDIHVYSAPGRTEIGGNHTDHQHGCVIAGAVDLDVIGVAAFHDENIIRIKSEGYDEFAVSLDDLDVHIGEKGSSEIVRGIAARFKDFGVEISGFDMYTTSNVLGGSGISVQIKGNDLNKLRSIGKDIAQIVEDTKGTQNISNGSEETTPDLHVVVDKKKAVKNGLTVATIYQQLSEKLKDASEATTITINEKEYSVNVGNSAKNTLTRDDLKKVKLTGTVSGKEKEVTLDQVANFRNSDSLSSINRNQQERTLSVTSEIKDGYNVGKVSSAVQKKIKKYNAPKGYSITMKGEMESIQETTGQIGLMLLLAVAFMYLIMVAQFQSLKSPFIILFTIPMAFTGGFLGLLITGKT